MERPRLQNNRGQLIMKKLLITFLCFASIFTGIPVASAHAQLISSNPVANKTISSLPNWVYLEFDGNLMIFGDKNPNQIMIVDSKKKRVDVGGSVVGGARLSTKLKIDLKPGRYLVSYRIVSEDGHPVIGSFSFTYRP